MTDRKMEEQGKKHPMSVCQLMVIILVSIITISKTASGSSNNNHFVLVHGSCHGAWCWYKLSSLLKSRGHDVTAIDLAASGIKPQQPMQLQSISQYFKPLTKFMASLPANERVVLVGHNLGGLAISHAMEKFPHKISVAVFVTASMPGLALNITTLAQESLKRQGPFQDNTYTYDEGPNNPPTTFTFGPQYLASYVYQQSPHEDWTLATTLVRPLRLFGEKDMADVLILSRSGYGLVKRVYVVSEKDRVIEKDFQWWMIEQNVPDRVVEISGSDHMVMICKAPDFCLHLQLIAAQYS